MHTEIKKKTKSEETTVINIHWRACVVSEILQAITFVHNSKPI